MDSAPRMHQSLPAGTGNAALAAEIRRTAEALASSALHGLRKLPEKPGKTIHGIRKDLKRLRAIVVLLEGALGKRRCRHLNRQLREVGRSLSVFRDAHVRKSLVEGMMDDPSGEQMRHPLEVAMGHVRNIHDKVVTKKALVKSAAECMPVLKSARKRIRNWSLPGKSLREELWCGIDASARQGRIAMARSLIHPTEENFHAWRKSCKTLLYQLELLGPDFIPQPLVHHRELLPGLTEHLGELNDLAVLGSSLEPLAESGMSLEDLSAVHALLRDRRLPLEELCRQEGALLFSEIG